MTTMCTRNFKRLYVRVSVNFVRFKLLPTHSCGAALPAGPNLKKLFLAFLWLDFSWLVLSRPWILIWDHAHYLIYELT